MSTTTFRWTFYIHAAATSTQDDCHASVIAKSLRQAVTKVGELLGLDGRGPDAECAGGLARHALVVIKSVEEL